jgi:hypothetical protein
VKPRMRSPFASTSTTKLFSTGRINFQPATRSARKKDHRHLGKLRPIVWNELQPTPPTLNDGTLEPV